MLNTCLTSVNYETNRQEHADLSYLVSQKALNERNIFNSFSQVFLMLVLSVAFIESAKLLRKPKVYNAIITTDENLTPSQAFPIIQPVIQPAISILSPFYPTNIYESFAQNDVNDARREFKVNIFIE